MEFVPVLCGASFKNKGVQALLDAVIDFLPAPIDVPAIQGHLPHHDETFVDCPVTDDAPFAALAFKIATDPFVGKLTFFRVYSGVMNSGSYVYNSTKDKRERVGRLLQMHANKRDEIAEVRAATSPPRSASRTRAPATRCARRQADHPRGDEVPGPGHRRRDRAEDQGRPGQAGDRAAEAAEEDPTFRVHTDAETSQTIISGWASCTSRSSSTACCASSRSTRTSGRPQVAYRETIKRRVEKVEGKFIRQSGGKGQYGHVVINMQPAEPGQGFVFEDKIVGGVVPREYIGPVEQGIKEALENGVLAGYPMVDVKVELVFGSYHEVDSSEMAFKIAGSMAFKEAAAKASPCCSSR
jgi:elongation factor G